VINTRRISTGVSVVADSRHLRLVQDDKENWGALWREHRFGATIDEYGTWRPGRTREAWQRKYDLRTGEYHTPNLQAISFDDVWAWVDDNTARILNENDIYRMRHLAVLHPWEDLTRLPRFADKRAHEVTNGVEVWQRREWEAVPQVDPGLGLPVLTVSLAWARCDRCGRRLNLRGQGDYASRFDPFTVPERTFRTGDILRHVCAPRG
jgi:hypothetical protein